MPGLAPAGDMMRCMPYTRELTRAVPSRPASCDGSHKEGASRPVSFVNWRPERARQHLQHGWRFDITFAIGHAVGAAMLPWRFEYSSNTVCHPVLTREDQVRTGVEARSEYPAPACMPFVVPERREAWRPYPMANSIQNRQLIGDGGVELLVAAHAVEGTTKTIEQSERKQPEKWHKQEHCVRNTNGRSHCRGRPLFAVRLAVRHLACHEVCHRL